MIKKLLRLRRKSNDIQKTNKEYPFTDRPWPVRYKIIKKYIPKSADVIDIGAGEEYIVDYIKPNEYFPIDIYPCTPRTTVVDLNKESLPDLSKKFDYVLAQGLFEYLDDGPKTMREMHKYSDKLVTTCYYRDEQMKLWKYLWNKDSFETSLIDNGWTIVKSEKVPGLSQYVYYCEADK